MTFRRQSPRKRHPRIGILTLVVVLSACGGGGDGGSDSQVPPTSGQPQPPPTVNHAPIVSLPNERQHAVQHHPYRYDAAQGGRTFTDPDGDTLHYELVLTPDMPPGLHLEGTSLVGEPEELGLISVRIFARDPGGMEMDNELLILVDPNSAPVIASNNDDRLVNVGSQVDHDASKAGAAFSDPDGDALAYTVTLRGVPRGLSISGTRVSGVFDSVGLVEITVTASDVFGGSTADSYTIAAPGPQPGRPVLPSTSYRYDDAALDLPFIFRAASDDGIPLWDTQPEDNRTTDAGATLGRVLFYDKRLSATNTVSCASCHQQSHGFSIPDRFGVGALGIPTRRHVMALANVRYNIQNAWFSDMRVESLRELALMPLANPEELGATLTSLEAKLAANDFYPPLFEAAFGTPEVTLDRIGRALAQFLQSLLSYRTKFDLAHNPMFNGEGDMAAVLTAQELRGAEIFAWSGPGKCEVCHEAHAQANEWQANNGLDVVPSDPGTLNAGFQRNGAIGVFRAASLRNIAVTAPYMHDGRFATLREVIDHYDHGVQDSPNLDMTLRDLTGNPQRLNLSEDDKQALEAFLNTFTDQAFLTDPKFSDPFSPE